MLYIGTAAMNSSFSVASISTPQCLQQQGLASGGHSCSRCPVIASETEYDVLLVAEASGASSAPVHTTVSAVHVSGGRGRAAVVCSHRTCIADCHFEQYLGLTLPTVVIPYMLQAVVFLPPWTKINWFP